MSKKSDCQELNAAQKVKERIESDISEIQTDKNSELWIAISLFLLVYGQIIMLCV